MSLELIISLVVAGILLVLCEVFIPGGVIGILGGVLLAIGIIGGFVHEAHGPELGMWLLFGSLVGGLAGLWAWIKFFPRSPMGKRLILQRDAKTWHGYDEGQSDLLDCEGTAHTPLRPAGTAVIGGKRIDVVTRGEMIDRRSRIRVIEVSGNRVVVEKIEEEEA